MRHNVVFKEMCCQLTGQAYILQDGEWVLKASAKRGTGEGCKPPFPAQVDCDSDNEIQAMMRQTITLAEAYTLRHELARAGKILYWIEATTGIIYHILFPPQRNEIGGWFSVIMISQYGRLSVVRMPGRRPVYVSDGGSDQGAIGG
jgi:hypothetical protein